MNTRVEDIATSLVTEPGQAIIQDYDKTVGMIGRLSGVTEEHFNRYYHPVLVEMAAWTQRLPDRATQREAIDLVLEQTAIALRRRQGSFMPPGASSEQVADQSDLWTYAVFLSALFQRMPVIGASFQVTLTTAEKQTIWQPWSGSMLDQGGSHYHFTPRVAVNPLKHLASLVFPVMVPPCGLAWLFATPLAMSTVAKALFGSSEMPVFDGVIGIGPQLDPLRKS